MSILNNYVCLHVHVYIQVHVHVYLHVCVRNCIYTVDYIR